MPGEGKPSLNALALPLVERLEPEAERLRAHVIRMPSGATVVDMGVEAPGGLEAGLRLVEICMGGLGRASLSWLSIGGLVLPAVSVFTDAPALATLGAQMAGWKLELSGRIVLGSGPARALVRKPKRIYRALGHEEEPSAIAILALEADELPDDAFLRSVAELCGIGPGGLHVLVASLRSPAGVIQVVGRAVEACLLKLLNLDIDVLSVRSALGLTPLPPPHPAPDVCMGRVNDAILYGSIVHLWADVDDDTAKLMAEKAPSCTSSAYGKPFLAIYEEAGRDFYAIDPAIFAPAQVVVSSLKSGRSYVAGELNEELVASSFGISIS